MMRAFVDTAFRRGASLLALALLCWLASPLSAQVTSIGSGGNAESGRIEARDEGRYSRVVFSFDRRPRHQVSAQNGVLVIRFERPVDLPVEALTRELRGFVSSARRDPDGTAVRIALSRKVRVNSSEAGDQLFIDFMPEPWVGPPPPLPQEVILELQRRAEETERLRRDQQARERRRAQRAPIDLVVGEAPTFTRLEFRSRDRVEATISRSSREVRIAFERVGDVDLGPIRARMPRFLDAIRTEEGDDRLIVVLGVDGVRDVRGFEESNAYVIDIIGPDRGTIEFRSDGQLRPPAASGVEQSVLIRGAPRPEATPPDARSDPPPPTRPEAPQRRSDRRVPLPPERPSSLARAAEPLSSGTAFVVEAADAEATGSIPEPPQVLVVQGVRESQALRIRLPFDDPTPAAVFARGQSLWMVFSTPRRLDAGALQRELGPRIRSIATVQARGRSILRLDIDGPFLVSTQAVGPEWAVTIADSVASPPRALTLTPRSLADGRSSVEIDLQRFGEVHSIEDPIVGDHLLVATALAPTAGLLRTQTFVDFHLLASAQGVALKPHTDDLALRAIEGGLVVEREAGLQLSFVGTRRSAVVAPQAQGGPRLGFVDFEGWKFGSTDRFSAIRDQLLARASVTGGIERRNARLDLARFNLAYMLAHEALIVLALVRQDEPLFEADPVFRFLRGVSNALAFRSELADRDLSLPEFAEIPDVAMWRGIIAERAGQWASARRLLDRARAVIPNYPRPIQAKALTALVESALALNDLGAVQATIEEMRGLENTREFRARIALFSARVAEAQGRREEAVAGYRAAEVDGTPADRANAQFRRIALQSEFGLITASDAARQLMSLSYDWRGDTLEPQLYARLVDLHLSAGAYREAFDAARRAMSAMPEHPLSRLAQDKARDRFVALFAEGEADDMEPVQALALFYDFSDLTPAGRRGDEIVRALAERLIAVDLLDQAAALLEHQVDHRLQGAQRSDTAALLGFVHLLNRAPEKALAAVRRTRLSHLPGEVERRRRLIEARAFAALGRPEIGIELLGDDQSEATRRLRADLHWEGRAWGRAASALEELARADGRTGRLSETGRRDVLRAAVAFALSEDAAGVERLRATFASRMSDTPEARAFDVLTGNGTIQGSEYRDVARQVAAIDTLGAFLADYRDRFGSGRTRQQTNRPQRGS